MPHFKGRGVKNASPPVPGTGLSDVKIALYRSMGSESMNLHYTGGGTLGSRFFSGGDHYSLLLFRVVNSRPLTKTQDFIGWSHHGRSRIITVITVWCRYALSVMTDNRLQI